MLNLLNEIRYLRAEIFNSKCDIEKGLLQSKLKLLEEQYYIELDSIYNTN